MPDVPDEPFEDSYQAHVRSFQELANRAHKEFIAACNAAHASALRRRQQVARWRIVFTCWFTAVAGWHAWGWVGERSLGQSWIDGSVCVFNLGCAVFFFCLFTKVRDRWSESARGWLETRQEIIDHPPPRL
jgi:uncharacterized membrane protein